MKRQFRRVRAAAYAAIVRHVRPVRLVGLCLLAALVAAATLAADIPDEFKVKREEVFEFAQKPVVTREGDKVTIAFESKGFCDVTVAIENEDGRILRHLVSGVLGPKAPEPLQKDSKKQVIAWDGKDDRGVYVDDKASCTVRVSLGLKPRFERTLFWSPNKRISNIAPIMAAAPEGVYVFEGMGVDHLRLFDHAGNYVRTIYPFPADKIPAVIGLQKHRFHPDGVELPKKMGFELASLLTSGSSAWGTEGGHEGGYAATSMAVYPPAGDLAKVGKRRIALAYHRLNRLTSDGDSGGLPILGPNVSFKVRVGDQTRVVGPTSLAFSPDGKYLYLTGFIWKTGNYASAGQCYHMVTRMEYDKQDEPQVFLGVQKTDDGYGSGNDRFCVPASVACDPQGRVYVADHCNQRIQVFAPDGEYLKTLRTPYPTAIRIDPATGEIWSFSGEMIGPSSEVYRAREYPGRITPTVARLGTFDQPKKAEPQELPGVSATGKGGWIATGGQTYQMAVDTHAQTPTIWLAGRKPTVSVAEANWESGGGIWGHLGGWENRGIRLIAAAEEGKWKTIQDFAKIAAKKVHRLTPPQFSRQRLYVNPTDRSLYVCEEQTGPGKSFYTVIRIDPNTGKMKEVSLPHDTEDIIFDTEGLAYLATDHEITRFDVRSWREVPWDYGEERQAIRFASSGSLPAHRAVAALPIPGSRPVWWHSSGMWISPKRHLAVICNIPGGRHEANAKDKYMQGGVSKAYAPFLYPGRSGNRVVLVFDPHGKIIHDDAVPGMTNADGIGIDNEDNLYLMVAAPRLVNGKPYPDDCSETLMKFKPGRARLVSSGEAPVPLAEEARPKREPDVSKYGMGATWVEGVEWMYGGVGYGGQGGSCTCWHSRFQLDTFARSFVPEVQRFGVAVLDTNGNLVLRVGKYGNVDDGQPLIAEGGPAVTRSIGGDEVALVHAAYVGVDTDNRLLIHDAGNGRILSVKLGYHAEEKVALKDVSDQSKK